jgi:hypothetical protein
VNTKLTKLTVLWPPFRLIRPDSDRTVPSTIVARVKRLSGQPESKRTNIVNR